MILDFFADNADIYGRFIALIFFDGGIVMKIKKTVVFRLLALAIGVGMMLFACDSSGSGDPTDTSPTTTFPPNTNPTNTAGTGISFTAAAVDKGESNTNEITLTFSEAVSITIEDVSIVVKTSGYSLKKNSLTGSGRTYTLKISSFNGTYVGPVSCDITVAKSGIESDAKAVVLQYNSGIINYDVYQSKDIDSGLTAELTFTFGKSFELKDDYITITPGSGSAYKGDLSGSGKTWKLGITSVSEGDVSVKVSDASVYSDAKKVSLKKEASTTPTGPGSGSVTAIYIERVPKNYSPLCTDPASPTNTYVVEDGFPRQFYARFIPENPAFKTVEWYAVNDTTKPENGKISVTGSGIYGSVKVEGMTATSPSGANPQLSLRSLDTLKASDLVTIQPIERKIPDKVFVEYTNTGDTGNFYDATNGIQLIEGKNNSVKIITGLVLGTEGRNYLTNDQKQTVKKEGDAFNYVSKVVADPNSGLNLIEYTFTPIIKKGDNNTSPRTGKFTINAEYSKATDATKPINVSVVYKPITSVSWTITSVDLQQPIDGGTYALPVNTISTPLGKRSELILTIVPDQPYDKFTTPTVTGPTGVQNPGQYISITAVSGKDNQWVIKKLKDLPAQGIFVSNKVYNAREILFQNPEDLTLFLSN